jgi:hypothetical protein
MIKVTLNDPIPHAGTYHDEPGQHEIPYNRRHKTMVQWPPVWLVPLIEYASRTPEADLSDN